MGGQTCSFSWGCAGGLKVGGTSDRWIREERYMSANIPCPTTAKGDESCYAQAPFSPSHFLL